MKNIWLGSILVVAFSSNPVWSQDNTTLEEKYGYSLGYTLGKNIQTKFPGFETKNFLQAMQDALNNNKPKLNQQEMAQAFKDFENVKQQKQAAIGEKNIEIGKKYINEYAKKEGVKPLSDGIYYKILKTGKGGVMPKADSTVEVHYKGTLINGTVFDSSYDRGQPVSFPLNRVIKGWTIAVQKMQAGDKWEIVIPSDLAYGVKGAPGGKIGPNETLIFEVELLKVL